MTRAVLLLLALLGATPAQARPTVAVGRVIDGDTVVTTSGERIRLACIDAPERGVAGDRAATSALRHLVEGRRVGIRRITHDRYERTIAELFVDETNVGEELVRRKFASIYRRYAFQCPWAR